jgi:hypothetical protein
MIYNFTGSLKILTIRLSNIMAAKYFTESLIIRYINCVVIFADVMEFNYKPKL